MHWLVWLSAFLLLPSLASAQFTVYGGANLNTIRSQYLVGDVQPQAGYQIGISSYFPVRSDSFRPGLSLELNRKGYVQEIDNIRHIYRLTYFIAYPHVNYFVGERWSVAAGIEIGGLISARYQQGVERIGVIENYRDNDVGLRAELRGQFVSWLGFYAGYTHGLRKLIEYPAISDSGDFIGTIRDVQLRTAYFGIIITVFKP
ncbi:MAG: hypothetical protein AAF944_17800 [Bacteroidota bacterium]